jgi:hypothetical protein
MAYPQNITEEWFSSRDVPTPTWSVRVKCSVLPPDGVVIHTCETMKATASRVAAYQIHNLITEACLAKVSQ